MEIVQKELGKVNSKIDNIIDRLERVEAVLDALEQLPKIGDIIAKVRKNKKLI